MRPRHTPDDTTRAREFEAYVAGAGGRLLHTATLLTAEARNDNPRARHLVTLSLARTYACWDRLHGEDPYDHTRQDLVARYARGAWHRYGGPLRSRSRPTGPLATLSPQERLVLVIRLYEGVDGERTAALLGLPVERVRTIFNRAMATVLRPARPQPPAVSGVGAVPS
ncbi:RNA polymerase subunit sigma-70 [Streptomyces sp. CHD11]|uniref:sigma factor-like helix-turn-helix DNA-binding protein n=1 Tax=Streptomyces sp. CHD11 TaxID=2741325 RepID=UPI001BFC10B6|nr:sigma factor-like helix-turn-helix DNA-binding protein [Streptomyces sp. CHD11]MBT3151607.1 RNA polymerase subunit sigma-70 [Streptomyces sp. CHD11]